jgi:outer membrane receptor protein involved in Fe transport
MNASHPIALLAGFVTLSLPVAVRGQQVAAAPTPVRGSEKPADAIVLSPFEVAEDSDTGYGALNSNSITRFKVELEKMPVSADIMNETFMNDIAAFGVESLLREYAAGAGTYGGDPAAVATNSNPMDRFDTNMSIRGMGAPTVQRDAFMPAKAAATSMGFTTNFDIERVEVINGPQSLLYGFSGAGGAINLVPKQARFGKSSGSFRFQIDNFENMQGTLDFNVSRRKLALRGVVSRQELGNRRSFVGGPMDGLYGQLAWRPFGNTVVRLTESYTHYRRIYQSIATLTALSTANDARNGLNLRYLLATNQIEAAANGQPSGAGVIGNGRIDWDNVDSTAGRALSDHTRAHTHAMTTDTVWSRVFSTQVAVGYAENRNVRFANGGPQFVAPNVAANITREWASAPNTIDINGHTRAKAMRVSGVLTNALFGGRAQSQTAFGADYTRNNFNRWYKGYARVDASGNPIVNPSPTAATNGYSLLPRTYWAIPNGPIRDLNSFEPGAQNITINGINYTYVGTNEPVPSLISPTNPLGLTGRGQGGRNENITVIKGAYLANFTSWLDGRLSTLAGVRAGSVWAQRDDVNTVLIPSVRAIADSTAVSFYAGLNYAWRDWLRPYISISDSHTPPVTVISDPYGNAPQNSRGTGGEIGFKLSNERKTISGSIAYYMAQSSNEQYLMNATLATVINPNGLNGEFSTPGPWIDVARKTNGIQIAATATPRENWRMRLSAGTFNSVVETDKSYDQLYNDQFHANAAGQVTYRDGTVVFVSQTATQVVPSTTAGAEPLTIAMMNTPGHRYYANPALDSAQINSASGAAAALRTIDPVHGPILTGATGLPISNLQIAPNPAAPPPGVIVASRAGDLAVGNPKYSVNFTNIYTFASGPLKGVRLGGTIAKSWQVTSYYYYPSGVSPDAPRVTFNMPRPMRIDGIVGYERRLGRYRLSTQLNISNLFNRYDVVLLPSATTGFNGARGSGIGATFNTEPRMYVWSATVGF